MSVPEFGIYVHWPFCAAKCPYCDFNSHVRTRIDEDKWTRAIKTELGFVASELGTSGLLAGSVFFGGGTPSLVSGRAIEDVLDEIAKHWNLAADAEITLEANPSSADAGRFRDYRRAGVNRLSLGIQALNDRDLGFLGRLHNAAEAKAAIDLAKSVFDRISIDMIYGRPGQGVVSWRAELRDALSFGVEHLSLYMLTIEPGTQFAALVRAGRLVPIDDEAAADLYEATQDVTGEAGLPAYEISNHARPGRECRHNLLYWRYGNYAGVGPGAHGRLGMGEGRLATATERLPERWLARVARDGHGFAEMVPVAPEDAAREHLLMNLRLSEGIDLDSYRAQWRRELSVQTVRALVDDGLAERQGRRLAATPKGRLVLDALIAALSDDDSRITTPIPGTSLVPD